MYLRTLSVLFEKEVEESRRRCDLSFTPEDLPRGVIMVEMINEIEISPKMCLVTNLQGLRDADETVDDVQAGRFGVHPSLLHCKAIPDPHRWKPLLPRPSQHSSHCTGDARGGEGSNAVFPRPTGGTCPRGGSCSFFRTSKLCTPLDTAWRASARALSRKSVSPSVM